MELTKIHKTDTHKELEYLRSLTRLLETRSMSHLKLNPKLLDPQSSDSDWRVAEIEKLGCICSNFDDLERTVRRVPRKDLGTAALDTVIPLTFWEELLACLIFLVIFPGSLLWIPVSTIAALLYWPTLQCLLILAVIYIVMILVPATFMSDTVLTSRAANLIMRYFSWRQMWLPEHQFKPEHNYILVAPPHGVLPLGNFCAILYYYMYGNFKFHGVAASVVFLVPFVRHFFTWFGVIDAGRASFGKALKKRWNLGLSSGGVAEVFETNSEHETIVLRDRKGFVKQALMTGTYLVPFYVFGNTKAMTCLVDPLGIMQAFSRKIGFGATLFWGRFFLPIPHRTPLLGAMGEPLELPTIENPTNEEVDYWHAEFLVKQMAVFEDCKVAYGWADKELIIK